MQMQMQEGINKKVRKEKRKFPNMHLLLAQGPNPAFFTPQRYTF